MHHLMVLRLGRCSPQPPHSPGKNIRKAEAMQTSPHHVTGGGEVAAEQFKEDGDGNSYSDEEGKYI